MSYSVIRSGDRAETTTEWLTSRHGFSFGDHYDPANTHHGVLLVHNDEIVLPGQGFDAHPHRETEIVTWVTSGSLVHQDSAGHSGVVYPGLAQAMSAGTGVEHSERNDTWPHRDSAGAEPAHYVQMWLLPDEHGRTPSYDQHDIAADLTPGRLVAVASGDPTLDSAIRIANRSATLHAARLRRGQAVIVPTARFLHLFVTAGSVRFADTELTVGDTLRGSDLGGEPVTAVRDAEILMWAMATTLGE
ncbi:pirin family protein [Gordonia soli]|uniref:Pirin N-terminal domain-containing protein n=1 Tax=Gordonia soli NBRC 108243 TaxID=1223545 RepID=M0QER8_9ACTN|nr:pirin-like bicupin family protein [Gordonia soli]GAC67100.1 hypothetical protein GS4_05_03130 [Gordonia soli NBRC 108243]